MDDKVIDQNIGEIAPHVNENITASERGISGGINLHTLVTRGELSPQCEEEINENPLDNRNEIESEKLENICRQLDIYNHNPAQDVQHNPCNSCDGKPQSKKIIREGRADVGSENIYVEHSRLSGSANNGRLHDHFDTWNHLQIMTHLLTVAFFHFKL